jgi:hypothetical protein
MIIKYFSKLATILKVIMMKGFLLEIVMVIFLFIVSGIVLADDFLLKSEHELLAMKKQIQRIDADKKIHVYRMPPKNKMRNLDGVNQTEHGYKQNQFVNELQYFYVKNNVDRSGIISL